MKAPWKYRVVSADEFDKIHYRYKERTSNFHSSTSYYCASIGSNWYRRGVRVLRDVARFAGGKAPFAGGRAPRHWTRKKPCGFLIPGKDIVDCLCGIYNGRGKLSWLVGQHYVGMCPFKTKWRIGLKLKSFVGKNGRK